ncbi:MAG TPA: glycosyltransferase [Vitreimonas sp.]|nr:glycosyltransferase [Vitreimonas sp.]
MELLLEAGSETPLAREFPNHIKLHCVPSGEGASAWMMGLLRFFREHSEIQVVHSHYHLGSGFVLGAAALAGIRVRIAHIHTQSACHGSRLDTKPVVSVVARQMLSASATAYLSPSMSALRDVCKEGLDARKLAMVLPYGVNEQRFAFDRAARLRMRHSLGISPATLLVGHVGRFVGFKNHTFLINAFAACAARRPNVHLLLIGDGALRPEIETLAYTRAREKVTLLGVRSDVPELLSAMDVFVFPSRVEGLGLAAVEAQASGLPIVMSEGVPEEAVAVAGLVRRLSLGSGPQAWGREIAKMSPSDEAERMEAASRFSQRISVSAQQLSAFYDKANGR